MADEEGPTKEPTAYEGMKPEPADSATTTPSGVHDEEPPVPEGKIRLSKGMVDFFLAWNRKPFLDACEEILNGEEVSDEKREVYLTAMKNHVEIHDEVAVFQNDLRQQLALKGVVDIDDDFPERVEKAKAANRAAYLEVFGSDKNDLSDKEA